MHTTVSARLDTATKESAESILSALGLSHSSAIAALYSQIVLQRGMPFEIRIPQEKKADVLTYQQIRNAIKEIAPQYDIERVWLFGSYARGEASEKSDVDLLIDKGGLKGMEIGGFIYDLEQSLGSGVDVVTTTGMSEKFHEKIKADKDLIYER